MSDIEEKKQIYTDSYKTKEILWDAYEGYKEHYSTYIMLKNLNRKDMLNTSGLLRYAHEFYEEMYYHLEHFEEELGKEDIKKINAIFEQEEFFDGNYSFMRRFFNKFMMKTGIKDVSRKVNDPGKAVRKNR